MKCSTCPGVHIQCTSVLSIKNDIIISCSTRQRTRAPQKNDVLYIEKVLAFESMIVVWSSQKDMSSGTLRLILQTVFLLLMVYVQATIGLSCISCNKIYDKHCIDPFVNITQLKSSYGVNCSSGMCFKHKVVFYDTGQTFITRSCATKPPKEGPPNQCQERKRQNISLWRCYCTTDFCNNQPRRSATAAVAVFLLASCWLLAVM